MGKGKYNFIDFKTQIQYGAYGRPTTESLTALANEIADAEGQSRDSVTVYYYKASDAETAAMDAYINEARQKESAGQTPYYIVGISDCVGFTIAGLRQGNVDTFAPYFSITNLYAFGLNKRLEGQATGEKKPDPEKDRKPPHPRCLQDREGRCVQ